MSSSTELHSPAPDPLVQIAAIVGIGLAALALVPVTVPAAVAWGALSVAERVAGWYPTRRWWGLAAAVAGGAALWWAAPLHGPTVGRWLRTWITQLLVHHHLSIPWSLVPWGVPLGLAAWPLVPAILSWWRPIYRDRTFTPDETAPPPLLPPAAMAAAFRRAQRAGPPRRASSPGFPLGVIRDRPGGKPLWIFDTQVNQGVAIFGATGSGKTTTEDHFAQHAMREGMSQVIIDAKGDTDRADRLRRWAASHARPFRHWTAEGPDAWNPLAMGTPTELKDKLVGLTQWSEDHYRYAAERFLQAVFAALAETASPISMMELVPLLATPNALAGLARQAPQTGRRLLEVLDAMEADRSLLSAVQGLIQRLAVLAESDAGPYLARADIDLRAALTDPAGPVVLFTLPKLRYPAFVPLLGSLILQDLKAAIAALYAEGRRARALLLIDEFGAFATEQALEILSQARGAGIHTVIATQDPADFATVSPHLPLQVLTNTAVKIVHRLDNPDSAELLARAIGTRKGHEVTHQVRAADGSLGLMGSLRAVDEFVVHPQLIKTLPVGMAAYSVKVPTPAAGVVQVFPPAP